MKTYRQLLGYFRPYTGRFISALVAMLFYSAATGATALLVKNVLDDIFIKRDAMMLKLVPLLVVGVYLIKGVSFFIHTYLMKYIGQSIIKDLRDDIFDHLMGLPMAFYDRRSTGSIMSRFLNDVTLVQYAVTNTLASVVRDPLTILALVCVLVYRDWILSLVAFVVLPVAIYPMIRFGQSFRRVTKKSQAKISRITTLLHETISGIKIVKAFGMEDFEKVRLHKENDRLFWLYMKTKKIESLSPPVMEFLGSVGIAAVVLLGGSQVINQRMSTGEFFSFMTALIMLYEPFKKLTKVNNATQEALAASERIFKILDETSDIKEKEGAKALDHVRGEVSFEDVSFSYSRQTVLRHINLDVKPGEVIAIVGSSGGGKSTLLSLIPRFYDVDSGSVRIDGHDVRDLTLKSLRSKIAIVTQEMILFNDTVRSNIAYGRAGASVDEIVKAAVSAYADEFIQAMPEGYDTVIGERGITISGGERQRLCIARAILADAPILILDEATSSLDAESEMLVQKALENLMVNRTTFIIAHRLGTIVHADRIVVIDEGTISQIGSHQELMAGNKVYQRLYRLQFRETEQPT